MSSCPVSTQTYLVPLPCFKDSEIETRDMQQVRQTLRETFCCRELLWLTHLLRLVQGPDRFDLVVLVLPFFAALDAQ